MLDQLFTELDQTAQAATQSAARIREKIQARLNVRYTDWTALQLAITNSEASTQYMYGQYGDVLTWYRFGELADVPEREREYLEQYLSDFCITVDWQNDCFERSEGCCLIINSDGDVYDTDSGKVVIELGEYYNNNGPYETKRNKKQVRKIQAVANKQLENNPSDRLTRIKANLEKINRLMNEARRPS